MSEEKKNKNIWVDAVARMIELTQQGEMRWSVVEPLGTVTEEQNRTSAIFRTTHNGKVLRLYERRVVDQKLVYNSEQATFIPTSTILGANYVATATYEIILEFVDNKGATLWTFPKFAALRDLLTAVQYQAAGVKEFLHDLFSESNAAA